jgi:putative endonuclease
MPSYYVYIMASKSRTLYTGLTNDLERRVFEHKNKLIEGFTSKYNISKLVWFEEFEDVDKAIEGEKRIKGWRRSKNIGLIESANPQWLDLAAEWFAMKKCHSERSDELHGGSRDPSVAEPPSG